MFTPTYQIERCHTPREHSVMAHHRENLILRSRRRLAAVCLRYTHLLHRPVSFVRQKNFYELAQARSSVFQTAPPEGKETQRRPKIQEYTNRCSVLECKGFTVTTL